MIPYWLTEPRLAVDGRGIAHVVWVGIVPGGNRVYYTRQADDGAWLSPRVISVSPDYAGQPVLVAEPGGNVHVAWRVWECILYAQAGDSPRTGDSTIAQTVSVPVETSDPTLSLFYQFGHTWSGDDSWFAVQVQDGVTATSLFSTTAATADWTHRWFDLSPWAGQAITLTFNVHQTAGGPTAWAYLDEVTVGSGSYPDLWIGAPTQLAQPGAPVTYTLAYGNRGDGLARDGQISLTLPAGLSFVSADPSPSALGPPLVWNLGDLPAGSGPATIVIAGMMAPTAAPGSLLISTVGITTSTLEVEPDNNQTQMYVFVDGRRRYLPLIRR